MHILRAIAVSETTTLRGENNMKKLLTTLTVLTFALGLTASGYTQTTVKKEDKPAVQTQAPATGSQVTPVEKDKGKEAAEPVAKEGDAAKGKKPEKQMSKQDTGKKAGDPAGAAKKEVKKEATK
jgi:hypothetical protein